MNYVLQHLAHLVQIKNELNRKRRRFYHLYHDEIRCTKAGGAIYYKRKTHKSFSYKYARAMYNKTKQEMKSMTQEMRETRKLIDASLVWSSWGEILAIRHGDHWYRRLEIEFLAEQYKADKILLGD